ncbi:MAG: 50S ribosomal protein L18 [Thermoprotei archaeon]
MSQGPRYRLKFKRRRLGLTDYRLRLKLLLSGKPRLVLRRSNRYVYAQFVTSKGGSDRTLVSLSSKELARFGYPTGLTSAPACYLTGLLMAKRVQKVGFKDAVLDIGLAHHVAKSDFYAFVKGCQDGGLNIPCSEEVLPDEFRISGGHIAEYAKLLKANNPEKYTRQFAGFISANVQPERLVELFNEVKQKILESEK